MAGIDNIIQTILGDARAEVAQAEQAAQQQAAQITAQAEEKIAARREDTLTQARTECEDIARRARVAADLEKRKATLAYKQQCIESVFARVRAALENLPQQEYDAMLCRLAVENANGGETFIPCGAGRAPGADVLARVNEALVQSGREPLVQSSETRPINGGFILANQGVEINCSLDAIVRYYRTQLAGDVAAMLFEKEA